MKTGQIHGNTNIPLALRTLLRWLLDGDEPRSHHAGPTGSERDLRARIETLQAENKNLRHRIGSLPDSAGKLRALESVARELWLAMEQSESSTSDPRDTNESFRELRKILRSQLDGADYRRPDSDGDVKVTPLRYGFKLSRVERRPSQHNVVLMWADERRRRECADERLKDLEEFVRLKLGLQESERSPTVLPHGLDGRLNP